MDLIEKSLEIALKAYAGQKDKAGETYILHPLRVMAKMRSTEERCVALLHDVIEDSEITAEALIAQGLPKNVVIAIEALTKNNGESYEEFVDRVMENSLAKKVKIADIEDNINVLRLNSIKESDLQRVAKYHRAWKKLSGIS